MSDVAVFLIESDGLKGRTVVKRFVSSVTHPNVDVRVVVDDMGGKAIQLLERMGTRYTVADDPSSPSEAISRVTDDVNEIRYLISCGWVYKIPEKPISMASYAINCHSSYLPDYKGLSVHRAQWAHAEPEGGATIHFLTEDFDEGDIICQDKTTISVWDTPLDIAYKYSDITTPLVREAILLLDDRFEGESHSGGRYFTVIPWSTTIIHGIVNHLFRAAGWDWRWEIESS